MSIISLNTGDPKISEIGVDSALPILATGINEDGLTGITQVTKVLANALRGAYQLLTSDGPITWNGTTITNNGNNLLLKLANNPTAGIITITIPTSVLNTFSVPSGSVLYLQVTRTQLLASFTATGANVAVATEAAMPAALSTQSETAIDATLTIPIFGAYSVSGNLSLWWFPNGIYWPQNTSSVVGSIATGSGNPVGSVTAFHLMGNTVPVGTPSLGVLAPGWALCNGGVIINTESSYANATRNSEGFPTGSYSPSQDFFVPMLNGTSAAYTVNQVVSRGDCVYASNTQNEWAALSSFTATTGTAGLDPSDGSLPPNWSSSNTYTAGTLVSWTETSVNGSGYPFEATYKAINNVGPSATSPFNDTTNWQPLWALNLAQQANPFYRSGYNDDVATGETNPNSYVQGSSTSPSGSGAYGGSNLSTLATPNLPSHQHGITDPGHRHSSSTGAAFITQGGTQFATGGNFTIEVGATVTAFAATGINATQFTGNGDSFNNAPRSFSAPYIIKIF